MQTLIRELNRQYGEQPSLWELDSEPAGFSWLAGDDVDQNVIAYVRFGRDQSRVLACAANLSPVVRYGYRLGLPVAGQWCEALNTDSSLYGGSDVGNLGAVEAEEIAWHGQPCSAEVTLPPLAVVWFVPESGA